MSPAKLFKRNRRVEAPAPPRADLSGVRCGWCDDFIVREVYPRSAYAGRLPPPPPGWLHRTSGAKQAVDADGALHSATPRAPKTFIVEHRVTPEER